MADTLPRRRAPQDRRPAKSSLVIRNIFVGSRRTSVRLEPTMWDALTEIARLRQKPVRDLVTDIERDRTASSLTAAIRVYIVEFYRAAAAKGGAASLDPAQRSARRTGT